MMAGDWIKMRTNLDTDPRIIAMASVLEIPELHVVGCCWKIWAWADSHSPDGNSLRITDVTLDRFTGVTGFASALRSVGWLDGSAQSLSLPRFTEHNGQSAKKRAETAMRVAKHREQKRSTSVAPKSLPEKRREEKRRSNTRTPKPPLLEAVPELPELPPILQTPEFKERLLQWLKYKAQKKQAYEPMGLQQMISKAAKRAAASGLDLVLDAMETAMANGWQGWDQASLFPEQKKFTPIVDGI